MRIAYAAIIISILVIASISLAFTPTAVAKKGKKIKATGEVVTLLLPSTCGAPLYVGCISKETIDDKEIRTYTAINIFTGTLIGNGTDSRVATAYPNGVTYATAYGHWVGTVGDSEEGSFSYIMHYVVDLSAFLADGSPMTWEGQTTVVDGTGLGGLDGICGGGPFSGGGTPATGFVTTYDFEFRFGKDCKKLNPAE